MHADQVGDAPALEEQVHDPVEDGMAVRVADVHGAAGWRAVATEADVGDVARADV